MRETHTHRTNDFRRNSPVISDEFLWPHRARMHAHRKIHQPRPVAIDDEGRVIRRLGLARRNIGAHGGRLVDEAVHTSGLRLEIAIKEVRRIDGMTSWIESIFDVERIERRIDLRGIFLVEHRGIEAAQSVHRIARMGVEQQHSISLGEILQLLHTLRQLVGALAIGKALFRRRLIEGRSRAATRKTNQDHFGDPRLLAQELNALPDVERHILEPNARFIIVGARVHAENKEPALGELPRADHIHEIRRAVNGQESDIGRRAIVRRIKSALGR